MGLKEERADLECLRVSDVARELGISQKLVWRLLTEKRLPGFKLGRVWLIRRSDLDTYLTNLTLGAREATERRNSA